MTITQSYQPYLDKNGKIQTKRILDDAPPRSMIPQLVLNMHEAYLRGDMDTCSREKIYRCRRVLRRYWLLQPTTKLKYNGLNASQRKDLRRQHAREYYRTNRRNGRKGAECKSD